MLNFQLGAEIYFLELGFNQLDVSPELTASFFHVDMYEVWHFKFRFLATF
jgi:hypothetical protein